MDRPVIVVGGGHVGLSTSYCLDGRGRPCHERGVTDVAGLYVVGLPWLYTWGSVRFAGIARDAEHIAELIELGDRTALVTSLPRPAFGGR